MIPTHDQLQAISRQRSGNLAETPFAVLLQALAVHRRSVLLEIEREPLKKTISFEAGVPVDCRSNLLHDTLSGFMVARGDLTPEVAQECLDKSALRGLRFGEVLILEGLISPSSLYRMLQQNLAKKLLDGFSWRDGVFRILDRAPELDSSLKISTPQLVTTGISRFALDEEVNKAVGPLVGKPLFLNPRSPHPLNAIRLSADQRRLTDLLRGGKRIDELASATPIDFSEIMRFVYALAVLGMVVPEERLRDGPAAPAYDDADTATACHEEIPAKPHDLPASEVDTQELVGDFVARALSEEQLAALREGFPVTPPSISAEDREVIMEAYLQHRKQDAFEVLSLEESTSPVEIEDKFLEFAQRFAPWRLDGPGLDSLAAKAQDVFLAGCRAYGELCDPDRRNALVVRRQNLRDEQAKRQPKEDRFVIKSDLLDPEVQFKKGRALMDAARYPEARRQLEFAFDCDPQNSLYRTELAHCRFLEFGVGEAEKSLAELREVLRIDRGCGPAIYVSGLIEGSLGNFEAAEGHLQRAIKFMRPDRRPIEALKALQAKRKEKGSKKSKIRSIF